MFSRFSEASHPLAYGLAHMGVHAYEWLCQDLTIVGRNNIPASGGGVVAYTHRDVWDPLAVGVASPRPLASMGKQEIWTEEYDFRVSLLGYTIHAGSVASYLDGFPIDRKNPGHVSFSYADSIVANGRLVSMAPEMSRFENEDVEKDERVLRGPELGRLYEGAGLLAVRNNALLIPVGVGIVRKNGKVKKTSVVIKEPLSPNRDPEMKRKQRTADLMSRLRTILQAAHDEAAELSSI